ncbi:hypothetical protein [Ornithinimicrobium pekingense]|uniref:Uncharacterized protein n=1 Tax=Ornithinimicrobium pekingense TaxID=384677 RepID=A0ABQ2F6J3_9MICO|nr:hypothetical protein [Ornithinimicrobium pekingense]GGK66259.1 hypothetical protein GCM10011509_13200 [Ornithinimicrobium pekingense]
MSGQVGDRHATLTFADVESLVDLSTYVGRARAYDTGGAIRLQAVGAVLAAWVCVLPGRDLVGSGTVLGLRTMPLAGEHRLDATVPLSGLTDRFARRGVTADTSTVLTVPPTTVSPPWGGVTPPRSGWAPVGQLGSAALLEAARRGVAEVAEGTPGSAGAPAVAALRARVWGRLLDHDVPAGAGLAALALGFAREGGQHSLVATVHRAGPWTRVSLPAGHILCR